jgi:enamine deaminase RidA (YjgF/YER057c/UK114 family)
MAEAIETAAAPRPRGHYSQTVRIGSFVFVSGQLRIDRDGNVVKGTTGQEAAQALENIRAIVEAAEGTIGDVVQCRIYISDIAHWVASMALSSPKYLYYLPARSCPSKRCLGLSGELPDQVDPAKIEVLVNGIRTAHALLLGGIHGIPFDKSLDLLFHKDSTLPAHPNGMSLRALDERGVELAREVYYSVGGGFVKTEAEMHSAQSDTDSRKVPYPFKSAGDLLRIGEEKQLAIWQIVFENEKSNRSESDIREFVERIWNTMHACMLRGLETGGILPGGLNVRRRAPRFARKLEEAGERDPLHAMDWINVFAMAVNEENAAGRRVVMAPMNGAAGVIPAVGE